MFKYKNVMIALFALFFFSTSVHFIYSCLTLEPNMRNTALLCDCVLFMAPLAVFISGELLRRVLLHYVGNKSKRALSAAFVCLRRSLLRLLFIGETLHMAYYNYRSGSYMERGVLS